jgi:mono/diheme cytochrome c family protein
MRSPETESSIRFRPLGTSSVVKRTSRALVAFTMGVFVSLFVSSCSVPEPDLVTHIVDPSAVMSGKELAQGLAACGFCHGQLASAQSPLVGGRIIYDKYGQVTAPNITGSVSGVGTWTTNQLVRAIRAGVGKDEALLSPEVHRGFEWMADEDVLSIVSYLRSLPPVDNTVERRSVSFIDRNTTGFFDRAQEVRGYVARIQPRFEIAYGEYLATRVARCQSCHNGPSTLLTEEQPFAGGKTIVTESGERIAPGITGAEVDGLGNWSEQEIVHYLQSGETPEGRAIDPEFCPVEFYRNAAPADLKAIAHFLKAVQP